MTDKREIDAVTGVETTGHVWDDDIRELNKPLPRWWLLTFYATILWAIGYWIAYPAWPTVSGYTKGMLGYSQRDTVARDLRDAEAAQGGMRQRLQITSLEEIRKDENVFRFAMTAGGVSFQTNCAPCHGRGAQGFVGYPNLNDDKWLWGGTLVDIEKTILYGIRSEDRRTRTSQMPRFGLDKLLDDAKISDVADYVLSLSGRNQDAVTIGRGAAIFKEQCANCHGDDAKGKIDQGSPSLTDGIWLFGGTREAIVDSIRTGRGAGMPAWVGRIDPATIKALTIYVHSLGGGK